MIGAIAHYYSQSNTMIQSDRTGDVRRRLLSQESLTTPEAVNTGFRKGLAGLWLNLFRIGSTGKYSPPPRQLSFEVRKRIRFDAFG
jgi:hypothetical protein